MVRLHSQHSQLLRTSCHVCGGPGICAFPSSLQHMSALIYICYRYLAKPYRCWTSSLISAATDGESSAADSEDMDSEDDNDEFDDMDNANEADATDAQLDTAGLRDDESALPSPPETDGQSQARDTEHSHKQSNTRDLKATGVARAAARLLQQDTLEGGLGILSV